MASRQIKKKLEVIDRIASMLEERLEPADRERAQRFARDYYAGLGPEDLLTIPVEDLYGSLLCHWQLCCRRKGGTTVVCVYNPNFEEHGWQSTTEPLDLAFAHSPLAS